MTDPDPAAEISRRDFFAACSILAASLAACSTLTDRTRVAAAFIVDPPADEYMPALRDLIRILLPFDRAEFPLSPAQVETRLLRLFPLEKERRFLGLQRTLVFFNQLDLIPHTAQVLIEEERKAADVPARLGRREFRQVIRQKVVREMATFSRFVEGLEPEARYFTALPRERQREYFEMWQESELLIKREFAGGLRYLVMVTAYSDDRVWPALGYDGPLIRAPRAD